MTNWRLLLAYTFTDQKLAGIVEKQDQRNLWSLARSKNLKIQSVDLSDHRSKISDHRAQIKYLRSNISDHRSKISDHRAQITDLRSQISDHRSQISDHRSQITQSQIHSDLLESIQIHFLSYLGSLRPLKFLNTFLPRRSISILKALQLRCELKTNRWKK